MKTSDMNKVFREGIPKLIPVIGLLAMLVKPDLLVFELLEAENLPSLPVLLYSTPNIGYQLHKVDLATKVGGNEGRLGFERLLPREEFDTYNFSSRVAPAGWRLVS